jgi:hypothetical protein
MAGFSAAPNQGHLWIVRRIFAYCKKHDESKVVFDPQEKDFDHVDWTSHDWSQFYPDITPSDTTIHHQEGKWCKSTYFVMTHMDHVI